MCGGDQSGGAGGIRTAEPTRPALHRRDFLDARGREHDALFRACLVPDSRLLGGSPSLLAGKNAGNFADSAAFLQKYVTKTCANSAVCKRIPYADEQGILSRPQGIN